MSRKYDFYVWALAALGMAVAPMLAGLIAGGGGPGTSPKISELVARSPAPPEALLFEGVGRLSGFAAEASLHDQQRPFNRRLASPKGGAR